jgi:hypothetical protein
MTSRRAVVNYGARRRRLKVTYFFSTVPEPTSISLVLAAMICGLVAGTLAGRQGVVIRWCGRSSH